jgi:hypothetical protein
MARKFNNFTYLNTDTMSLVSNLHHTISDTEGRASFSVVGFVPLYDPRIDSSADSPFLAKFGKENEDKNVYTKFPDSHSNIVSADSNTSPFTVLAQKLDGILSSEDVYLWKPGTVTDQYTLQSNAVRGEFGEFNFARIETGTYYSEDDDGVIKFDPDPQEIPLDAKIVKTMPASTLSPILKNVQNGETRKHQFIGRQLLTGAPYRDVWGFTPNADTNDTFYNASSIPAILSEQPNWFQSTNTNKNVPTFDLDLQYGTWTNIALLGGGERTTGGANLSRSSFLRSTQGPVYNKTKQINYNQLTNVVDDGGISFEGKTITDYVNNTTYAADVYRNIRYFAKSATEENELSKTVASYRIQLDDQVGSIMFNKIVTYVRLYLKNSNDVWEWSDRLYPLTVTILPEPITKSNYGQPGMDSFELDIQIDYNQGEKLYSFIDTNKSSKISNWIPIVNGAAKDDYNRDPALPRSKNPYVGLQWDGKIILSANVNPTSTGEEVLVVDPDAADTLGVTKIASIQSNEAGRITSENTSSIYKDIDIDQVTTSVQTEDGQTITMVGDTIVVETT